MGMIAITVDSPDLDSRIEPRFGRAAHLVLVDPDTMAWQPMSNPDWDRLGLAGVRIVEALKDRDVTEVVSGQFGPRATDALAAARITPHRFESGATAREAVESLKAEIVS